MRHGYSPILVVVLVGCVQSPQPAKKHVSKPPPVSPEPSAPAAEESAKAKLQLSSIVDGDGATLVVAHAEDDERLEADYRCHWRLELRGQVVSFDYAGLAHEGGCLAYATEHFPKSKFPYTAPVTASLEIRPKDKPIIKLGPTAFQWDKRVLVPTRPIFAALEAEGWTFTPFDQLPYYGKDFYAYSGAFRSDGGEFVCAADIAKGDFANKPVEQTSDTIALDFKRAHLVRGPNHEFMISCEGVHTQKTGHSLKDPAHKKKFDALLELLKTKTRGKVYEIPSKWQ